MIYIARAIGLLLAVLLVTAFTVHTIRAQARRKNAGDEGADGLGADFNINGRN